MQNFDRILGNIKLKFVVLEAKFPKKLALQNIKMQTENHKMMMNKIEFGGDPTGRGATSWVTNSMGSIKNFVLPHLMTPCGKAAKR